MMLIDEVAEEVFSKTRVRENRGRQVAIYMDYEYWSMCMSEIKGQCSGAAYDFHNSNTLLGYPVYKVIRHNDNKHVPFRVVLL